MTTTAAPIRRTTGFVPFRTPVRGHVFAARPPDAPPPAPGQRVALAREPHNPADPLAVAVWLRAGEASPWRIGYLARDVAARVAPRLDEGVEVEARLDGWVPEPERRWQRPVLAVFPVPDRYEPRLADGSSPRTGTAEVAREEPRSGAGDAGCQPPVGTARPRTADQHGPVSTLPPPRPARSVRRTLSGTRPAR